MKTKSLFQMFLILSNQGHGQCQIHIGFPWFRVTAFGLFGFTANILNRKRPLQLWKNLALTF